MHSRFVQTRHLLVLTNEVFAILLLGLIGFQSHLHMRKGRISHEYVHSFAVPLSSLLVVDMYNTKFGPVETIPV